MTVECDAIPSAPATLPASDCTLSGTLEGETTLSPADCPDGYVLSGGVMVGDPDRTDNDAVLHIEPGTVIYGDNATNGFLAVVIKCSTSKGRAGLHLSDVSHSYRYTMTSNYDRVLDLFNRLFFGFS